MYKASLRVLTAVTLTSGCGLTPDIQEQEADQALSADFVDGSGMVTVRIKQCPGVTVAEHNTTTCAVDNDFVLIGGGAEVVGEADPGALLTASFPDSSLTTWTASSKDHILAYAHRLNAYSVGLKLAGLSASTLRGSMVMVTTRSAPAEHPSIAVTAPPGFNLIGGGARANWISEGQLLYASFPRSSQWVAASKDHVMAETGTVDAFAIGITTSAIPGFGTLDVNTSQISTFVPGGYGTASLAAPAGWVLASVGANAQGTTEGRLLTDLIPFVDAPADTAQGITVRSKDHRTHDSGSTFAYVTAVRKH